MVAHKSLSDGVIHLLKTAINISAFNINSYKPVEDVNNEDGDRTGQLKGVVYRSTTGNQRYGRMWFCKLNVQITPSSNTSVWVPGSTTVHLAKTGVNIPNGDLALTPVLPLYVGELFRGER